MNYETYKSSKNEWIGEIPSHWNIVKLKYAALVHPSNVDKKQNEGESQVLLCNYVDVYKNEFIDETIKFMEATASENEIQKFKIQEGDVLITKDSETPDDIAIPAFVAKDLDNVLCGYHLALLRSQKVILMGFYLYYLFKSYRFNQQFTIAANGITRFGLSVDDIKNAYVSTPPLAEQAQIASFLDYKSRQIDDLIDNKQKLIELLKEERTAIINQAVTNGLDPTVPMKNSGIEWLVEIPKHWEITKIKYSAEINKDTLDDNTPAEFEFNYVDIGIVSFGKLNGMPEKMLFKDAPSRARRILHEGDTIISTVRTYLKAILFIDNSLNKFIGSTGFAIITPSKRFLRKFLFYIMTSQQIVEKICSISVGVSYPATNASDIGSIPVWIPPLSEQEEIVNFIEERINHLTNIEERSYKEIELISEYKTSLINEAITGKIDVRDYKNNHA